MNISGDKLPDFTIEFVFKTISYQTKNPLKHHAIKTIHAKNWCFKI